MNIDPIYADIGARIAARRRSLNRTQQQVADAIELSRPSIANIEAGRQGVLVHQLYQIAAALLCSPGDLAPKPKLTARDIIVLRSVA